MARPFKKNPISVSYTAWKRYKECPQKHFLVMTGRRPNLVDERNFLNGSVLHKVMERWLDNDEPVSWIADQAEPVWEEYVDKKYILFKGQADKDELRQKCILWGRQLVKLLTDMNLNKHHCDTELHVEKFIEVDGYQVRLHGYIDILAATQDDDHIVMDLKCSASRSVMDPYQMVFYSLLLEDVDRSRHATYILPALDDIVHHEVTEEHRQWLLADIQKMVRGIIADEFEPDPENANCFWCEVKPACPVMGGLPAKRGRVDL